MRSPSSRALLGGLPTLLFCVAGCSAPDPTQRGPGSRPGDTAVTGAGGSNGSGSSPGTSTGGNGNAASGGNGSNLAVTPGLTTVRRLTNVEYRNSVKSLLALPAAPTDTLEGEVLTKGHGNFSPSLTVNGALASEYAGIAKSQVSAFAVPACPDPAAQAGCARSFIESFGRNAFRRPVSTLERDAYIALFTDESTRTGYAGGITQVVETMLQSPLFLYRSEVGDTTQPAARKLTSHEAATLLSYMFTAFPPDAELAAAADANSVSTAAELESQARRLLKLPEARGAVRGLIHTFAGTSRFSGISKDFETYPDFAGDLKTSMAQETDAFIDSVLWEGDGTLNSLFTAPYSFVNTPLAKLYGLPDPGQGLTLGKQTLPVAERAGLVTLPAVLATHSKAYDSFPILRGKFVRVTLLCQDLPAPPANVSVKPPVQDPSLTTRERFSQHSSDSACSGCHALIDPVGFGLENYDGIGRYRTTENGKPVDASGNITGTLDMDGPFQGGPQLATKLAQSQESKQCLTLQAYRWALGRDYQVGERELVNGFAQSLASGGLDVREALVAITQTDNFVSRLYQ